MIERLVELPVGENSFFLFGPRQTGKTTLVQQAIANREHFDVDLLATDVLLKYARDPSQFRREIEMWIERHPGGVVFVDEIQRLPILLNEIQGLIERHKGRLTFVLTGSSARKLKCASANMLGGRAWSFALFPLTHLELKDRFSLDDALNYGSLPVLEGRDARFKKRTLHAYVQTYLKEEVLQEALIRNVPAFSRFLELAADQSGSPVNYSTMARDTGVASKTIRDYYQILEDTLIAFALQPYVKSARRRLTTHPIYYLFDLGVINQLCGRMGADVPSGTSLFGKLFEQFIILEVHRILRYQEKDWGFYHWRTHQGAEVDCVIETGSRCLAVEIKSADRVRPQDLSGLRRFLEDHPGSLGVCVSRIEHPFRLGDVLCMPWQDFFDEMIVRGT